MTKYKKLIIFTDGGARGNPGPAAIGAVLKSVGPQHFAGESIGTQDIAFLRQDEDDYDKI